MTNPGLRERKKQKTRWAIQEHALRLIAEQGYEATTVEQIAAAAEVSPSTFFRYFKTKEDVVVEDDYDPLLAGALRAAPPDLAPIAALRFGVSAAFAQLGPDDLAKTLARTRLTFSTPSLRARSLENVGATIELIAEPLAARLGRDAADYPVRAIAGAVFGAFLVAITEWQQGDDPQALPGMMDAALAALETF